MNTHTHAHSHSQKEERAAPVGIACVRACMRASVRAHETSQFAFARRLSDGNDGGRTAVRYASALSIISFSSLYEACLCVCVQVPASSSSSSSHCACGIAQVRECACVRACRSVRIFVSATRALIAMRARFIFSITLAEETHEPRAHTHSRVCLCVRVCDCVPVASGKT